MMFIKKADEASADFCKVNNIEIISHKNVNPKRHLNRGRLHFNDSGVSLTVCSYHVTYPFQSQS